MRRNYDSSVESYKRFVIYHGYLTFPATITTITHWIADLVRTVKPETAKAYLNALRSHHLEHHFDTDIFHDQRIDLIIHDTKRCQPQKDKHLQLSLTYEILCKIIRECPPTSINNINIRVAICVGFAAFLRSGEFTWNTWNTNSPSHALSRRHITFNRNNSATLFLPSSKTDPFRKGVHIQLTATASILCPIRALKLLFQRHPTTLDQPLFARTMGPFSKSYFIAQIHELLLQAGIPTQGFSDHSIRKDAAVSASARGISKDDIKLMGRWKSDVVLTYINETTISEHNNKLLLLNKQLQTPLASSIIPGAKLLSHSASSHSLGR